MQGRTFLHAKWRDTSKPQSLSNSDLTNSISAGIEKKTLRQQLQKLQTQLPSTEIRSLQLWAAILRQGYSLLLYGYGDKKAILEELALTCRASGGVLAVDGRKHSLTLRTLLIKVMNMTCGPHVSRSGDARTLAQLILRHAQSRRLYLLIHGIDCPALRSDESQAILGLLASIPHIHLAATAEHCNSHMLFAPVWFNVVNCQVTTAKPYRGEVLQIEPLLRKRRAETKKQNAAVVLQTLVPKSRIAFCLLAKQQLEGGHEAGTTFNKLYNLCRERFLVDNESALHGHLQEFIDHDLVQVRRTGHVEYLHIPMSNSTLSQILTQFDR